MESYILKNWHQVNYISHQPLNAIIMKVFDSTQERYNLLVIISKLLFSEDTLAYENIGLEIYTELLQNLAERFESKNMWEEAIRCYSEAIVSIVPIVEWDERLP